MTSAVKAELPSFVVDEQRRPVDVGSSVRKKVARAKSNSAPDIVYSPRVLPRAAFFKASDARTKRQVHTSYVTLVSARNVEVHFKGPDLRIFDFLVWTHLAMQVRNSVTLLSDGRKVYGPISMTMRSLCLLVGLPVNLESYERLHSSLDALWEAEFKLVQYNWNDARPGRTVDRLRMLSGFRVRAEQCGPKNAWQAHHLQLHLDAGVLDLFVPGHFCSLDANALRALIKAPVAAWLYAHLSTHSDFSKGMRYETLQSLAGLESKPLYEVRRMVKAALATLERHGHVTEVDTTNADVFKLRPCINEKLQKARADRLAKASPAPAAAPEPVPLPPPAPAPQSALRPATVPVFVRPRASVPVTANAPRRSGRGAAQLAHYEFDDLDVSESHSLLDAARHAQVPREKHRRLPRMDQLLGDDGQLDPLELDLYGDSEVECMLENFTTLNRGHPALDGVLKALRSRLGYGGTF